MDETVEEASKNPLEKETTAGRRGRAVVNYKEKSEKIMAETVAVRADIVADCEEDAIRALCPDSTSFRWPKCPSPSIIKT